MLKLPRYAVILLALLSVTGSLAAASRAYVLSRRSRLPGLRGLCDDVKELNKKAGRKLGR